MTRYNVKLLERINSETAKLASISDQTILCSGHENEGALYPQGTSFMLEK